MKYPIFLKDILELMQPTSGLPDGWDVFDNILPGGSEKVQICFMSEEETWITTYPEHPILIPFYDCPVVAIGPSYTKADTIQIWLGFTTYLQGTRRWIRDTWDTLEEEGGDADGSSE